MAVNNSLELVAKPKIICVGSYDLKGDHETEHFIQDEIRFFLKQRAKELDLKSNKGLQFLKKKQKKLQDGKILPAVEKALRSKILKIFEDLMGKRPVMEILISLVD